MSSTTDPRLTAAYYFDLGSFAHRALFAELAAVWEVLPKIGEYCAKVLAAAGIRGEDVLADGTEIAPTAVLRGPLLIGEGTVVEPGVFVQGPGLIGRHCQLRQGAYLRGNVVLGEGSIVGHASEVKNSVFLDEAKAPHFAYVGDSVLGRGVNLGAGTKISNFKITGDQVHVLLEGQRIKSGLRKFGAILGDGAGTGCNSVLSPGTLIGPRTLLYANITGRGFYPADSLVKLIQEIVVVEARK
jgi:NDP-sugar pyrophosphorylase family protein